MTVVNTDSILMLMLMGITKRMERNVYECEEEQERQDKVVFVGREVRDEKNKTQEVTWERNTQKGARKQRSRNAICKRAYRQRQQNKTKVMKVRSNRTQSSQWTRSSNTQQETQLDEGGRRRREKSNDHDQ